MYSWNSLCLMLCFTRTPTAVFCPLFVDWQPPVFSYWTELSGLKVCCDCIESLYKCDENTVISWIFHFRFELLLLLRCRLTACFFSLGDVVILNSIPACVFMHLLQLTDSVRDKFTNFISLSRKFSIFDTSHKPTAKMWLLNMHVSQWNHSAMAHYHNRVSVTGSSTEESKVLLL